MADSPTPSPTSSAPVPAAPTADASAQTPAPTAAPSGADSLYTPPADAPVVADAPAGGAPAPDPAATPEPVIAAPVPIDPASYTFTLPEGFTEDAAQMTSLRELAAANNLPPEAAQSLLDAHVAALTAQATAAQTAFDAAQATWTAEINALPEFTGEKREATLATIGKFIDTYGGTDAQAVREVMQATGVGNHPAVVRMILRSAQALSEGQPSRPAQPAVVRKTGAEALYGNSTQK